MTRRIHKSQYINDEASQACLHLQPQPISSELTNKMTAPFPSFTKSWHTDTYDAISPKRSELSLKGKKVVVVGGGSGIGRGLSQAFADAGASSLVILGRRTALLEETKKIIEKEDSAIEITTLAVDIVDASAVKTAAKSIGVWDVLVLSAGYLPEMNSIVDSDVDEWWRGCEVGYSQDQALISIHDINITKVNIKGSFNVCHSLLPQRSKNASIISISAGSCHVQIDFQVNASGYNISKFALLKFFEILAAENPDVHVVSMHPGVGTLDLLY